MYTKQRLGRGKWLVHYETMMERYTKEFTSEKKADLYIKNNIKL
jgi:hypothetical protein